MKSKKVTKIENLQKMVEKLELKALSNIEELYIKMKLLISAYGATSRLERSERFNKSGLTNHLERSERPK